LLLTGVRGEDGIVGSRLGCGRRIGLQDEADPRDGLEKLRRCRVLLDLPPQSIHRYAEGVSDTRVVVTPYLLQDRRRGYDAAGTSEQTMEKAELRRGQLERMTIPANGVVLRVEFQRAELQSFGQSVSTRRC